MIIPSGYHAWGLEGPQTSYCRRKTVPFLAPHFRVIAPDLLWFADSEKPEAAIGDILRFALGVHSGT